MKSKFFSNPVILLLIVLISFYVLSCKDKNTDPQPKPEPQPTIKLGKLSLSNQDREYIYNTTGKLTQIKTTNKFPSGLALESFQHIAYNEQGRIDKLWTENDNNKTETRYLYETDKVVKTEEYYNDNLTSYTFYTYNSQGQLVTRIIYQTDDYNQFREYWKINYEYNQQGNLTLETQYLKGTSPNWNFFQSFKFEDYDSTPNFEYLTGTPLLLNQNMQKNNPGKLTHTNMNNVAVVSNYSYEYNDKNYSVKKTISSPKNNYSITYSYVQ
jgi:hypothetical protein